MAINFVKLINVVRIITTIVSALRRKAKKLRKKSSKDIVEAGDEEKVSDAISDALNTNDND